MATVDPAKAAARRKAQRANAKAMKKGSGNPISGMAKAAAKTIATRSGPKTSETAHLSSQQFPSGGKHHAPSTQGAKKNAYGSMSDASVGRHSLSNGKVGHRGSYDREKDVARAYKDRAGSGRAGKHRKPGA